MSLQQQPQTVVSSPTHESVSHVIHLDDDESFSQLCIATHLLRLGSIPGQIFGSVTINEGVIRAWRDWLATRSRSTTTRVETTHDDGSILWADRAKHVGVQIHVKENTTAARPVLIMADEDAPVSYRLEYQGITSLS